MSTITNFFKKFPYARLLEPTLDWLILLVIGAILLIGSVAWNLALFDSIKSGAVIGGTATSTPMTAAQSLTSIQASLSARASEEAKYESGAYTFVDPSQE